MASLKTNVLLNLINTVTSILLPVITFPYATRVLQLEGIGVVNFLSSVVNYIILITGLGIPMYAVKEVARYRDDIAKRNHCTIELTVLSLLLCLWGYAIVALMLYGVERIHEHQNLFLILSLSIFFTAIGVNWFYQAVEDFKFITIRAIIFKVLTTASLFIFVKTPDDLLYYAIITVSLSVGNNFINFIHLRKFIKFRTIVWSKLNLSHHVKPAMQIFLPYVITNIYGNLNIVMLGFIQDDAAVGIYTAANKLLFVVLTIITSLSVVLLPRCSSLISSGEIAQFKELSMKSVRVVIGIALPCMAGMAMLAYPLIQVFCGSTFTPSSHVIVIACPVLLLIGLTNVIGIQIFYPQGKPNLVIYSTLIGAVTNFLLNFWLIPAYSYVGAAYSTLIAELVVLLVQCAAGRKYIPIQFGSLQLHNYLFATAVLVLMLWSIKWFISNALLMVVLASLLGSIVYGGFLLLVKDELVKEMVNYARGLLRRGK